MISIRNITSDDVATLVGLAHQCPPLEIHTQYTYWVCANYYSRSSFILEDNKTPIGYVLVVDSPKAVFLWQIGIIPQYRKKGLSRVLLSACADYAKSEGKCIETTIAEENIDSLSAVSRFCKNNCFNLESCGEAIVLDSTGEVFEREKRFRIHIY